MCIRSRRIFLRRWICKTGVIIPIEQGRCDRTRLAAQPVLGRAWIIPGMDLREKKSVPIDDTLDCIRSRRSASGFAELILTYTADGADPVIGDIFESGSGGYAVVGIALCRIIGVSADITYVTHVVPPLGENLCI